LITALELSLEDKLNRNAHLIMTKVQNLLDTESWQEYHAKFKDIYMDIAALNSEILRLDKLQYRQAPCYKFCESKAYETEIKDLKLQLSMLQSEY
jgi:hypothetical protein